MLGKFFNDRYPKGTQHAVVAYGYAKTTRGVQSKYEYIVDYGWDVTGKDYSEVYMSDLLIGGNIRFQLN